MKSIQNTVITNMLWRFAERCGAQGVSFLVSVILARLLLPEEYGVVSLITVFTTILNLFMDSGFKNALIQKRDADQTDYSTVFYFNVFMGVLLYLLMYGAAPVIARFYNKEYIVPYIRVMSLTLILGGINGVQTAVVAKKMEFKRFFYSTLGGTVVSAVIGIWMAYQGWGVWALIAQNLTNQTINTVILWFTVRWRPSFVFSFKRLKPLFRYGSKLLGSSLLNSLTSNLSSLVIGKVYSSDLLAYYDKGRRIPSLVIENLQSSVQSVLFPVIAERQEHPEHVKAILRRSFTTAAYCIFPCMMGIAVCAEPLIRLLYTQTWISMVPYLQLWCIIFAFYLLHTADLQVIQALGRSDIILKIEIIKQILSLIGIVVAIPFGVIAMMITMAIVSVISLYINAAPNKKLVGYGFKERFRDLFPIVLLCSAMGILIRLLGLLPLSDLPLLILQIVCGASFYLAGSWIFRMESFQYTLQLFKGLLHKK